MVEKAQLVPFSVTAPCPVVEVLLFLALEASPMAVDVVVFFLGLLGSVAASAGGGH